MNGSIAFGAPAGLGGANVALGILGLIFTAALVAATIIAIFMLVDAARAKGIEVKGAKLAGFWIMGIVLTPLMLGLYVLCLKPVEARQAAFEPAPTQGGFAPLDPRAPQGDGAVFVAETVAAEPADAQVQPTNVLGSDATSAIDGARA